MKGGRSVSVRELGGLTPVRFVQDSESYCFVVDSHAERTCGCDHPPLGFKICLELNKSYFANRPRRQFRLYIGDDFHSFVFFL